MDVRIEEYRFQGGNSNKYWRVVDAPRWTLYQYGRMGNQPQATLSDGTDTARKVNDKSAKGYQLAGTEVIELTDTWDCFLTKDEAKRLSNVVEDSLNYQTPGDWGGVQRNGSPLNRPSRQQQNGDDLDELLEIDNEPLGREGERTTLSQRAFTLMSRAATDPEGALVEFAILRDEVEELRAEADEAQSHVNTLAMMLGLEERV